MESPLMRINIAIQPTKQVAKYIEELSFTLSKEYEHYFVIDNAHYFPHITMYAPVIYTKDIEFITKKILEKTYEYPPITCTFKNIKVGQGYIGIEVTLTEAIQNLKTYIYTQIAPYALKELPEKYVDAKDYNMSFDKESLFFIRKYASVAMYKYQPHITISRLKNENIAKQLESKIKWNMSEFTASSIAIYQMGDNGTCIKLLKEFELPGVR